MQKSRKQKCLLTQASSCMKVDCSVLSHSRNLRRYSQITLLPLFAGLFCSYWLGCQMPVRPCVQARCPYSRLATLSDKQTSSCMKVDCSVLSHSRNLRQYSQITLLPLFARLFCSYWLSCQMPVRPRVQARCPYSRLATLSKYIEKNYIGVVFHCLFKLDSSCLIW